MGTCGLNAGAKNTLNAIADELEAAGVDSVILTQAPCMGHCDEEPMVEVHTPSLGSLAYGRVDVAFAKRLVKELIIGGTLIEDHRIMMEV